MSSGTRPTLFDFHGVQMVPAFTDNWDSVQQFQARPDDILVATYPKAGTTWVTYILDLLHFGQTDPERETSIPIYDRVPHLETFYIDPEKESWIGVDMINKLTTVPRIIKTHYPVQFLPKSFFEQNCKIVYVARNAKDNMVSYYHFGRMNVGHPDPGEWTDYFQRFLAGKMNFGSWYDHVNGWWQKTKTYSNLHYMFFEDLVENTELEINKLSDFLGLSITPEIRQQITGHVQFDKMKKNDMTNHSKVDVFDFKISSFMRKGKVGDWKNHFTVAQNETFDEDYTQKMKDPTLHFRTTMK